MVLRRRKEKKPEKLPEKLPAPAPAPSAALSRLTGTVRTIRANGTEPYGIPWSNVTRYAALIEAASREFGPEPERIAATIVIESDGDPTAMQRNNANGWSYGLMQVVPAGVGWAGWATRVRELNPALVREIGETNALFDPETNIRVGASILRDFKHQHGSWDKASSAFFTGGPDWGGSDTVNGTTGRAYRDTLNSLMAEIANNTKPVPDPKPDPKPLPVNPISVILGGRPHGPITYGWLADAGLNYYGYGVNHGTQRSTQHPGVDVPVPHLTPLYSPAAGVVDCVGAAGTPRWGQGCGAYPDVTDGGIGNITILLDSGHKLTLGHCHSATVRPGERVRAGQQVGLSGNMNGDHVHVEVSVNRNGTYWLVEPVAALREAMGGAPVTPEPVYAERLPVPQPGEWENAWTIEVTADRVPVKQYTSPDAPDVAAPLTKGEQFKSPMRVLGQDGRDWWISLQGGRVPVDGATRK